MSPELYQWFLETAARLSPDLRAAIAAIGRLEIPEREDRGVPIFLARAVVGQQLSTKAARSIWARLEAAAEASGLSLSEFCHEANRTALRSCGLSEAKVRSLLAIREAELLGHLSPQAVRDLDHLARSAHLGQIRGIGQWTCDMVSIFYCRDPDVWPEGDAAVQRVFRRYLGRRSPAKWATSFKPHRSLLAVYMWRILDGIPTA